MKKILSSILAVATIASVMLLPTAAESASVTQEVDVLYLSQKPTFDGVINADEWGEASFSVSGATAAKPGDSAPAADNTFAWYEHEYDSVAKTIIDVNELDKAKTETMSYDVWLRWDLDYLYIAAKVNDPDGYYLPAGRERIWDGDCFQFRVDPMGPNGYLSYKNPEYDYKTAGFDVDASAPVSHTPWAFRTKICNIGLGLVNGDATNARNMQCYDMADQGTGDMTKAQLLNDPNKLGPNKNPLGNDKNYASEFYMTTTPNGDGSSTNVYECAVPWNFLNQWGFGQVAVGYAWGMSCVVLNGINDGDGSPFDSYVTWGSGICGAQQDDSWLRPTIGGSNAIILSDVDAISGDTVADLPQAGEGGNDDGEVVHQIISAEGMSAYYLGAPEEISTTNGDYELSLDVAYLGDDAINPDRTYIGAWLGDGYGMAAGWHAATKKFFVAEHLFQNGINTDIPYSESEEEFDWQAGEWHNLKIRVVDDTVTIYLDDEVVLEDTDSRNTCVTTTSFYSTVVYNIGDYVYDNYSLTANLGAENEVTNAYTCDSDDEAFNHSDFQLSAIPMFHVFKEGKCQNADENSRYGCLMHAAVNAEGKSVMMCDFCGTEVEASVMYGDADGDGAIKLGDASLMLKHVAGWSGLTIDTVAADVDVNGSVNLTDVSTVLKVVAGWTGIVLGPKA